MIEQNRKRQRRWMAVAAIVAVGNCLQTSSAFVILNPTRTSSTCSLSVLSNPQRSPSSERLSRDDGDAEFSLQNPFLDVIGSDDDDDATFLFDDDSIDPSSPADIMPSRSLREEAQQLEEREDRYYSHLPVRERCLLVGVEDTYEKRVDPNSFSLSESLTEMRELATTAGLDVVDHITQRLPQVHPRTYMGTGKVQEVKGRLEELEDCCTVLVDAELSPGQQKALEKAFNTELLQNDFNQADTTDKIKVIDRTALILDIFAQHARTREGKLQVDLALHEYRKPRLTKMWTHLERQSGAGGVGLRGPGESQLEIDKRLVRDRIITLQRKINAVQQQRSLHRRQRQRLGLPVVALVGYTNAGKSSLLNALTAAGVLAESMLFATLDPTTRKVRLPGLQSEVLLTDTVGFIQKLPTHLVAAFRATLEEVQHADVLVHVLDVSNPTWQKQEQAVGEVLHDLGVPETTPVVRVLNKMDKMPEDDDEYNYLVANDLYNNSENTVAISARYGDGLGDFVASLENAIASLLVAVKVLIPYSEGQQVAVLHEQGHVQVIDYRATGTYIEALAPGPVAQRLQEFAVKDEQT